MTGLEQAGAGLSGLLAGTLSGFFGVGGNFVLVPALAFVLGLEQRQAQGLTLAALLPPLGLPAVLQYRASGVPLLWPVVGALVLGFLPAIPVGSALAGLLPAGLLRLLFAGLLVFNAVRAWRGPRSGQEPPDLATPPTGFLVPTVAAGLGAGFASGLLGIGGAIVLIPLLTQRLGMNQKQAQLTSLALLLPPLALPGVWMYARMESGLPWAAVLPVSAGFVTGAFAGGRLARVVSAARLRRGFAVLLATSAVALAASALRG